VTASHADHGQIPVRTPFPAVISARRTETAASRDHPRRGGHHRTHTTIADNLLDLSGASLQPGRNPIKDEDLRDGSCTVLKLHVHVMIWGFTHST
jgi:hypothetical protein